MMFLVRRSSFLALCLMGAHAFGANEEPRTKNQEPDAVPFRPESGKFPPIEKAHTYRGELAFVDHANRRGSIRVEGGGIFRINDPHPFALLPYGMVSYHGAPADLRDIPLGTTMHVLAYLPPDPKLSAVPVLPANNKEKDPGGYRGKGVYPAENHAILVEDDISHCLRTGKVWRLKEIDMQKDQGLIIATLGSKDQAEATDPEQKLSIDATTRFWRGRESLKLADLIAEGTWPASGKKSLGDMSVLLGLNWKPCPDSVFLRYHISDIWLDDKATQRAIQEQAEVHKSFIRSRWMPAFVDNVEYGKFGHAKVTVTLFGGMDTALYADFKKGDLTAINGAENTLKHAGGDYGETHMASKGPILDVITTPGTSPMGSSGIQVIMETDLIIEGIRPGRVVRIRAAEWPNVALPREEYLGDHPKLQIRFPSPAIFPDY